MRQEKRKIIYLMRYSCLSIFLLFLIGIGNGLLYAQETGEVVDDWSPPQLTAVSIISSNTNTAYAKVGDTVWVYFTADEPIDPATVNVKILGQEAALYRNKGNQTLSKYIVMDNNGAEGLIGFSISNYLDPAGNEGSTVSTVTNGSSITFDRTAPKITISGVNVTGGNVVPNYSIVPIQGLLSLCLLITMPRLLIVPLK